MPRFRLLLAWLLMAALPLQGWAAASMLFCGPAQRAAVQAHAQVPADAGHHGMRADTHAAHHEGTVGGHAHPHADPSAPHDTAAGDGSASHACGVCAACCHAVALAQTPHWPAVQPVPAAEPAEPLTAVLARASPVPDKPPRA